MIDHLEAENAQLKAHNRQLVEALESVSKLGTDKRKAHSGPCGQDSNSMHLNRMLFQQATDFKIIALEALQAPSAKMALAEADVLRGVSTLDIGIIKEAVAGVITVSMYTNNKIQNDLNQLQHGLISIHEAMQEARGDD